MDSFSGKRQIWKAVVMGDVVSWTRKPKNIEWRNQFIYST